MIVGLAPDELAGLAPDQLGEALRPAESARMVNVPRRAAVALLQPQLWAPPGIDPVAWRVALAEDVLDVLALLVEVEPAVAAERSDRGLLEQIGWPGLRAYDLPDLQLATVFEAVAADGYEQAAVIATDAPDLPGMLIAKLLRPLTSHPAGVAPAVGGGLVGVSSVLPAPTWIPSAGLDQLTAQALRRSAPRASDVAAGTGWHRLRGPDDLARLDPRLEGWEATRALLSSHATGQ